MSPMPQTPKSSPIVQRFLAALDAWRHNQSGNFALIFALGAVVLTALVGMGIDYYVARGILLK